MRTVAMFLMFAPQLILAQAGSSCPAPPAGLSPTATNIFSYQQEQYLGDGLAQIEDSHVRFVKDPAAEAYLEKIGQKLLATLPPNPFHFRYKIVDSQQVNAWSIAAGYVYFTRKLITAASSEDQIAGVMAHEFGHILIHQQAIAMTESLRDMLHVTTVSDRADVLDKLHRIRNAEHPWDWHPSGEKYEETADAVAVYALTKAGYTPSAYADFWNQVTQAKGKSSSVIGSIFHTTRPNEQRLRGILKDTAALPAGCITSKAPSVPPEFSALRERVGIDPIGLAATDADNGIQLNPALRADLTRLQFSPDGKFVLAQDPSSVFVLAASPLRFLFQIDAPNADRASFSPDSARVSFSTSTLHVEDWDVNSQQLLGAYDVLAYQPCAFHLLSPDGHVMACVRSPTRPKLQVGLTLWNVEDGNVILRNDEAIDLSRPSGFGYSMAGYRSWWASNRLHWPEVRWAFTPDGKRLMVNREPTNLVYDFDQHKLFKAGGALSKLDRKPMALVANDRVVINEWDNPKKSALYSFPEGKELKQISMGSQEIRAVTRGDYLLLSPVKNAALGVLDENTGKLLFDMPKPALDIYDKTVLMESADGGVALTSQGLVPDAKGSEIVDLPLSAMGEISAGTASPDGKFLALSSESRCAIWSTETGERIFSVRPFSAGYFDQNDRFFGSFPEYNGQPHAQVILDPRQRKTFRLAYPVADRAEQSGDVLLEFKNGDQTPGAKADFEVRDVRTNQVLWTRPSIDQPPDLETEAGSSEMVSTYGNLFSGSGQHEVKSHPELVTELKAVKQQLHAFLVEVLDKRTGTYLRGVVADVPQRAAFFDPAPSPRATAFGDFALIENGPESTAVYRFSTGARVGEVFGKFLSQEAASGLFCVVNSANELVIYDAATLVERKQLTYSNSVRFAEFLPARQQLMVVTSDQKVHAISLDDEHARATLLGTATMNTAALPR